MDIICFSHLRWDFVYQRPQHLMSRFALASRVFYIEEPVHFALSDHLVMHVKENVHVVQPHLEKGDIEPDLAKRQYQLLKELFLTYHITDYLFWFYTPMALPIANLFHPQLIVYDCMDELSAFKFAPSVLQQLEQELFSKADLVFTGGYSLYEAKKKHHNNIHAFPSSIDKAHFQQARKGGQDPEDQAAIPYPRLGFYGVLDERFDIELIRFIALAQPGWQIVLVGPVVKIDPATLPQLPNIHYLGSKSYKELPAYLSGWNLAMISFALNESTRFISPTKTPEYLAGGVPVVSTAIRDVINPYGKEGLVHIAYTPEEFMEKAVAALAVKDKRAWLVKADRFLANTSWNQTVYKMSALVEKTTAAKKAVVVLPAKETVYA